MKSAYDLQIDLLLEELVSPDESVRQCAIAGLEGYINRPEVLSALRRQLEVEISSSCRNDLTVLLGFAEAESDTHDDADGLLSCENIVEHWRSDKIDRWKLLKQVKKLPEAEQLVVIDSVFSAAKTVVQIIPLLFVNRRILADPKALDWLEKLLNSDNALLLSRVMSLLIRLNPVALIAHLARLLVHKNIHVRLLAIRALYLLNPGEAKRLLNELIFSSNIQYRRAAFLFFFLVPFPDISGILLRLMQEATISETVDQIISYLIANNPDPVFLKRISVTYLLHGKRIERLKRYLDIAAEALVIAKITDKSKEELKALSLEEARTFICSRSGQRPKITDKPVEFDVADVSGQNFEKYTSKKVLLPEEEKAFVQMAATLQNERDRLAAIKLADEKKLRSPEFCCWLESILDNKSALIVVAAMSVLAKANRQAVLPHLPVLVFSEVDEISEAAMLIFSSEFSGQFVSKLKIWLRDPNVSTRKIAYKCLLHVEFGKARELLLNLFKGSVNSETIRFYGTVLQLHPDGSCVYQLRQLAKTSASGKNKALIELAEKIQSELGDNAVASAGKLLGDAGLAAQWAEVLEVIKNISYEDPGLVVRGVVSNRLFYVTLLCVFLLAVLGFEKYFRIEEVPTSPQPNIFVVKDDFSFSVDVDGEVLSMKKQKPWDFDPPALATPTIGYFSIQTAEEKKLQYIQLMQECSTSAAQIVPFSQHIRLEVETR